MRDGGSGGEIWATPFPLRRCIREARVRGKLNDARQLRRRPYALTCEDPEHPLTRSLHSLGLDVCVPKKAYNSKLSLLSVVFTHTKPIRA